MINIFSSSGKVFVWNAEDVTTIRKQHRIVGSLVGIPPNKQFQIQTKWLPLQLMNEEAHLLIAKGIAQLVSSPEKIEDPSLIEAYVKRQEELCEEQITILKEERKKTILEKADEIYEGKKRKYLENNSRDSKKSKGDESELDKENNFSTNETIEDEAFLDKGTVIEEELTKVSEVSRDLCMVQLFTEAPWKNLSAVTKLNFPTSEKEKLRNAVFQDLWEKNFYITSGMKFGGDFLAYKGDPLKYHAAFIVVCLPASSKIQAIDLITYGRLGHQVKKTVALASLNNSGQVEYISLNWDGDL